MSKVGKRNVNFFLSQLKKGLFKYDLTTKGGEESDGKVIHSFYSRESNKNKNFKKNNRQILAFF